MVAWVVSHVALTRAKRLFGHANGSVVAIGLLWVVPAAVSSVVVLGAILTGSATNDLVVAV